MITDIMSSDGSLMVSGAYHQSPYVGPVCDDPRAQTGDVRYNGSNFEIFTGGSWMMIQDSVSDIQLSPRWQTVLRWAEDKMFAEVKEKELLEKSPALQKAKENYDLIKALVEND